MNFKDKYVLITGASSGIGYYFAHSFAAKGANLIVTARRSDRLESLKSDVTEKYSVKVHIITEDLVSDGAVDRLVASADALGVDVDILVNNAGFGFKGTFLEADRKKYQDMIQLNVRVLTDLMYAYLPKMAARKSGGILNVASMAGLTSVPYFSVYAATKAYVINMSEAVWHEYKDSGVHISAFCPGPVDTEFFEVSGYNPSGLDGRAIQSPEEVVETAIKGFAQNLPFVPSAFVLKVLSKVTGIVPRKLRLWILAKNMR